MLHKLERRHLRLLDAEVSREGQLWNASAGVGIIWPFHPMAHLQHSRWILVL